MIEIQAKLLRGPVYFCDETIQCLITLRNIPTTPTNAESEASATQSSSSNTNDQTNSTNLG